MKPLWLLTTNESSYYVRATNTELRNWMFLYIRLKKQKGVGLSNVLFAWTPIMTTNMAAIFENAGLKPEETEL